MSNPSDNIFSRVKEKLKADCTVWTKTPAPKFQIIILTFQNALDQLIHFWSHLVDTAYVGLIRKVCQHDKFLVWSLQFFTTVLLFFRKFF